MKNQYEKRSSERIQKTTIQTFQQEFKDKSHFEEWKGTYILSQVVRTILQAISLAFAIACVAYPAKYFFDYWLAGVPPALVILFFLEYVKRKTADVAFRNKFMKGVIPTFLLVCCLLASCASIVLSVVGTPLIVEEIAPSPSLVDTSAIQSKYLAKEEKLLAFWQPQIDSANAKAQAVFDQGNYRGKISGRTKDQKYKHENKAKAAQDSLNAKLAILQAQLDEEIASAGLENGAIVQASNDQTQAVAFWTAIGTFALEVLFYLLSFFCVRFRFVSVNELPQESSAQGDLPSGNNPNGGNKKRKQQSKQQTKQDLLEELFPEIENRFGEALNKAQKTETSTETKQEQQAEYAEVIEDTEENKTKSKTKTVILNKDIFHGSPTIKDGKKVLYYVVNKDKKNEAIRYYTEGDIRTNISTYKRRVDSARTAKDMEKLRRNAKKLAEWKEYLHALKDYEPNIA